MGRYREARGAFDDFLRQCPKITRAFSAGFVWESFRICLAILPAARKALEAFTSAYRPSHPSLELAWTYLGDTCFGLEDLPRSEGRL